MRTHEGISKKAQRQASSRSRANHSRPDVHTYWGFGLHIVSDIEFPELMPATFERADLTIQFDTAPAASSGVVEDKWQFHFDMNELVHCVPNVALYHAQSGEVILVRPAPHADARTLRLHLLSAVMPGILSQRGLIALHASAFVRGDRLTLLAGQCGAGKSTTAARLAADGYRTFTDDVCVLRSLGERDDHVYGVAAYPVIKLWHDSRARLEQADLGGPGFELQPGIAKHGYYIHDAFATHPCPIEAVFILSVNDGAEAATVREITGAEAFRHLEAVIYWPRLIVNIEMRQRLFSSLASIVQRTRVFQLQRPDGRETTREVARLVAEATR